MSTTEGDLQKGAGDIVFQNNDKERSHLHKKAKQTAHSVWRMAQRHLSLNEIEYVMLYGAKLRRAGVLHCYLRKKDIPLSDRRHSRYSRLEGTTVLLDSRMCETLVTVYRNRGRNALKKIRCKAKYNAIC